MGLSGKRDEEINGLSLLAHGPMCDLLTVVPGFKELMLLQSTASLMTSRELPQLSVCFVFEPNSALNEGID